MDKKSWQIEYPQIKNYLREKGFEDLTDIQQKAIPEILDGKSVLVTARTGSGKTLAYVIPTGILVKRRENVFGMEEELGCPKNLILLPTRELVAQVCKTYKDFGHHVRIRTRSLTGGDKSSKKQNTLKNEAFEVLISNTGKLVSALSDQEINLSKLEMLIIDEADQMFDMGFKSDLKSIIQSLPQSVQVVLFSATWHDSLNDMVKELFSSTQFEHINQGAQNQISQTIDTFNIHIGANQKVEMTKEFLDREAKGKGIIFVNKKSDILDLTNKLTSLCPRLKFIPIHGDLDPIERKKAMKEFFNEYSILIASDIAARGLNVPDINWILNFDLPFESIYYIHRCGRVGRDGKRGMVYNLITIHDQKLIKKINQAILSQDALKIESIDEKFVTRPQKSSKSIRPQSVNKAQSVKKMKIKKSPRFSRRR